MKFLLFFAILIIGIVIFLHGLRWMDNRASMSAWRALEKNANIQPAIFTKEMLEGLPEPAQRYFLYTIAEGTPLHTVSEIEMDGKIGLGTKADPRYLRMEGWQLLAPPNGFVWRLTAGKGAVKIVGNEGYDGNRSWLRFWLWGTIPVARAGDNPDHFRSSFGRISAEAIFWSPASLLPQNGVEWQGVNDDTALATIRSNGIEQSVEVSVNADGQPQKVLISRWSDANPQKVYQLQPFGGYPSKFKEFDGYKIPTHVEGGNFFGTDAYFPFYIANVKNFRFLNGNAPKMLN